MTTKLIDGGNQGLTAEQLNRVHRNRAAEILERYRTRPAAEKDQMIAEAKRYERVANMGTYTSGAGIGLVALSYASFVPEIFFGGLAVLTTGICAIAVGGLNRQFYLLRSGYVEPVEPGSGDSMSMLPFVAWLDERAERKHKRRLAKLQRSAEAH